MDKFAKQKLAEARLAERDVFLTAEESISFNLSLRVR